MRVELLGLMIFVTAAFALLVAYSIGYSNGEDSASNYEDEKKADSHYDPTLDEISYKQELILNAAVGLYVVQVSDLHPDSPEEQNERIHCAVVLAEKMLAEVQCCQMGDGNSTEDSPKELEHVNG